MAAIIKHGLALALAAALAALALAGGQLLWGKKIAAARENYERQLLAEVLDGVDYDELIIGESKSLHTSEISFWWRVRHDKETIGWAVRGKTKGYGGDIIFMAAFDNGGRRLKSRIIRHMETPGIADFLLLEDGGERAIDGVSGATITSTAVSTAIKEIEKWILQQSADNLAGGDNNAKSAHNSPVPK